MKAVQDPVPSGRREVIQDSRLKWVEGLALCAWLAVMAITVLAFRHEGMVAGQIFMDDIFALSWHSQFNLDFLANLSMVGIWVAWRHHFRITGVALGILCVLGGGLVIFAYVFAAARTSKGNLRHLLLGDREPL